jgi:hypothetical protein
MLHEGLKGNDDIYKIPVNQICVSFKLKQHNRWGLLTGFAYLNAALLAWSPYESGDSCHQPSLSRSCVVCLCPGPNAEFVLIFLFALHTSHASLSVL